MDRTFGRARCRRIRRSVSNNNFAYITRHRHVLACRCVHSIMKCSEWISRCAFFIRNCEKDRMTHIIICGWFARDIFHPRVQLFRRTLLGVVLHPNIVSRTLLAPISKTGLSYRQTWHTSRTAQPRSCEPKRKLPFDPLGFFPIYVFKYFPKTRIISITESTDYFHILLSKLHLIARWYENSRENFKLNSQKFERNSN